MTRPSDSSMRTMAVAIGMIVMLLLVACAGPGDQSAKSEVAASTPASAPTATPELTPATAPETDAPITDGDDTVDRIPSDRVALDASCKVDADCEVKDVGSCCGFYPRCLNKGTQTFPERVKAQCGKEGRVSACGFPAITSCECVQGKCSGVTISDDSQLVQ